ncbi:MAG: hypothetical protein H0T56_00345 [Pseudaminobacter sp.]|nr:hypothetical protein [Pseudaminobacter sp.]
MDAQIVAETVETAGSENTIEISPGGEAVSDDAFEEVVRGALDAVHGTMLFKMRIADGDASQHVAAAAIGDGEGKQFLVLTLPVAGGHLRVETAAKSDSPVAGIAASYAGLAEAFATAA